MNSRTEALAHLVIAIIIMLAASAAAYYIGGSGSIGGEILGQAEDGVKAGTFKISREIPQLPYWKEQYFYLVRFMGIIAGFILILWVILTHWLLRPSGSINQGKRWLWGFFGIIIAALCVALPYLFMDFWQVPFIVNDIRLPLLFFVCYCLGGYWCGSIFVTSDTYKYTPIFAGFIR